MKKILAQIRIKDFEGPIMSMIQRLMNSECYTTKFAAIQMIPIVYTYF
jgi:hypothetical protein